MSITLTIAGLLFVFKTTKLKSKRELQEKRMDIIDKHFNEMTRIECPYCKAPTQKILFPEIHGQSVEIES